MAEAVVEMYKRGSAMAPLEEDVSVGFPPDNPETLAVRDPGVTDGSRQPVVSSMYSHGCPISSGSQPFSEDFQNDGSPRLSGEKIGSIGPQLLERILGVFPLRSKSTGGGDSNTLFPLPTSRSSLLIACPSCSELEVCWMMIVCVCLNSVWGDDCTSDRCASEIQTRCLGRLLVDVKRVLSFTTSLENFDWQSFFRTRTVDYHGDEVKVAQRFCWKNIQPALPAEVGRVPLEDVCNQGARHYVLNFSQYLRPKEKWTLAKAPKVMVSDEDWSEVCKGLVASGVCVYLRREEIFDTGQGPLRNGLFGVPKDEVQEGAEVFRLIMNLIPLNNISESLTGDIETLPSWALMSPLWLQPSESLLVSSEDVRCFFYTMSVPSEWWPYLAFNKQVPPDCVPPEMAGEEVFLASRVLPMGFLNSVSLAQHVHRNLSLAAKEPSGRVANPPEAELRKDRAFCQAQSMWRVYLDNYDLLEKVQSLDCEQMTGSLAPGVLALRSQYEIWDVPRNMKKSVSRSLNAEVQGAQVDGEQGVAYPKEVKLAKYISAALKLVHQNRVSQRELQVVCGGLVYVSMFRRPLLGTLNEVWRPVESFNSPGSPKYRPLTQEARLELLRFLGLIPLARLDFRLDVDPQITCSDASTSGGGICVSRSLTRRGNMAAQGLVRGEVSEGFSEEKILSIGIFDGIGALRVALDLLGVPVIGHVGVEKEGKASRVVEANFPGSLAVSDVAEVDEEMVKSWSLRFSQATVVLLGAGPPCQGVSGLNSDRKGALRDKRSSLFIHVPRIRSLLKKFFPWAVVQTLMESVASMDPEDRDHMTSAFGCQPVFCDAGTFTWCSRPRLYWMTWDLLDTEGAVLSDHPSGVTQVILKGKMEADEVIEEGWHKADLGRPFPTFTTSRPRDQAGRKPAGVQQCTDEEILRWQEDSHRFPPYQYTWKNCVANKHGQVRLPSIKEKEFMMGFPVDYTAFCMPKNQRKTKEYLDCRHTLIGNTWSVPVVTWLIGQLFQLLGLRMAPSPQEILNLLNPCSQTMLQSRLLRAPLRPLRGPTPRGLEQTLARKVSSLVSIKGEDILLSTPTTQLAKYHRLRASVPSALWKWRIVSGWAWKGNREHINSLELRAVLTSLKWRICHLGQCNLRFLHLTDSLVCLHSLSRGRSSSKRLRRTLCRANALLLASSCQALWGYVHTDVNPADKPSRWGRRVRTKFKRHA